MARRFLILQLRPEDAASDNEFAAFLTKGGLSGDDVHRIRLDQEDLPDGIDLGAYAGIIVGGGPGCVSDPPEEKDPLEARIEAAVMGLMPEVTARDVPFLGCCYGIGILAAHLGGVVSKARYSEEVGPVGCQLTEDGLGDPLLAGLPRAFNALVGHKEAVQALPPDCVHLVASGPCPFQMIRFGRNVYATQFHPEADGDVFELRINIYRDKGYFDPGDAGRLIAASKAADVFAPSQMLRRFVETYRG